MTFRAFATLSALVISAAIPAGPVFAFTAETMPTTIAEMEDVLTSRTWQLRVEDAAEDFCREVYYFRKDGSMVALSGDEEIDATWELDTAKPKPGFILIERYLETNGMPDCQGDTFARPGDIRPMRYIPLENGTFRVCWVGAGDPCFGWVEPMDDLIG